LEAAGPILLEPWMKMDLTIPHDKMGGILSDLTSKRRGQVIKTSTTTRHSLVSAFLPLIETLGYATVLRSNTKGNCQVSLELHRYRPLSTLQQAEVIKTLR